METTAIKYPVGEQDFEKIREGKYLYVDKTNLVYRLANSVSYVFLSRPRRFGKTLLTSTLHYYFEGRKDLFAGLNMEQLEKNWTRYPVLHFDLSCVKECSTNDLRTGLQEMLNGYDSIYGITTTGNPGFRLDKIIQEAYRITGKPVVLLIDEYDAPIMNVLHKPDVLQEVRDIMRNFYTSLKANDKYLRFVFITGVSTFSQMGIFSELNNLDVITNDNEYASICGITQQELLDNFPVGIRELSISLKCSEEETLARLKDKYDGYHFTKSLLDVYNPFSLIKAFKSKDLGNYWFDTGTSTSLVNAFRQYVGDFRFELDKINGNGGANQSQFVRSLEDHASIVPLLYQSGYLTIKDYDEKEDLYQLGMPNAEVRVGLLKNLLPLFSSADPDETANAASRASTALREGNIDRAMELLRSALKSIPYGKNESEILQSKEATEEYYHKFFHFFFYLLYGNVHSEVRLSTGATDVEITTPKYIYVVEIKINASTNVALKQIDKKGYAVPHLSDPRTVYKVGVRFSTKERTLSDWKVVEAKGTTETRS